MKQNGEKVTEAERKVVKGEKRRGGVEREGK